MSRELKSALERVERINAIDFSRRGGTYIQFISMEKHIPAQLDEDGWVEDKETLTQIKKRWGASWVQIRNKYGVGEDVSRTVCIIHPKPPFEFLRDMMGVIPEEMYCLNFTSAAPEVRGNRFMESFFQVKLGKFKFGTNPVRLSRSNPKAKFVFARILSGLGFGYNAGILSSNRGLVEEAVKRSSTEYKIDIFLATRHILEKFYEDRIGDALCLRDLPWEKITITPEFLES
ncbi:hypothetical protein ACFL08_03935 [Patescibacteria group bacterium]